MYLLTAKLIICIIYYWEDAVTQQLERRADLKYFLPLSVRSSVIADGRRSCKLSEPHTFFLAHATSYKLHIEALLFLDACESIISDSWTSLFCILHLVSIFKQHIFWFSVDIFLVIS